MTNDLCALAVFNPVKEISEFAARVRCQRFHIAIRLWCGIAHLWQIAKPAFQDIGDASRESPHLSAFDVADLSLR